MKPARSGRRPWHCERRTNPPTVIPREWLYRKRSSPMTAQRPHHLPTPHVTPPNTRAAPRTWRVAGGRTVCHFIDLRGCTLLRVVMFRKGRKLTAAKPGKSWRVFLLCEAEQEQVKGKRNDVCNWRRFARMCVIGEDNRAPIWGNCSRMSTNLGYAGVVPARSPDSG
jgi:hypothetical protein